METSKPAHLEAALRRCPTLLDALTYLDRRQDRRRFSCRERRRSAAAHHRGGWVVGEPSVFAIGRVHARGAGRWGAFRRNGGELFDHVAQVARGEVDPSTWAAGAIVESIDTPQFLRELWEDVLRRFPYVGEDLEELRPAAADLAHEATVDDPRLDADAKISNADAAKIWERSTSWWKAAPVPRCVESGSHNAQLMRYADAEKHARKKKLGLRTSRQNAANAANAANLLKPPIPR